MPGRNYNSGTINISAPSPAVATLGLKIVAQRVEDDLVIEVTSTATGYDMEVVLRGRAYAAAVAANLSANFQLGHRQLLARYDQATDAIETLPTTLTVGSAYFLHPKYDLLKTIKFEGHGNLDDGFGNFELEVLTMPPGFVKDIFAGFGATYELRFIIDELERAGRFTELVLSEYFHSSVSGSTAHIVFGTFDKWRRAIKRSHSRAVLFGNSAKRDYLRAALATELGLTARPAPTGLNPADLADSVLTALSLPGRQPPVAAAIDVVKAARTNRSARKAQEAELLALNREIELLTLEELIARLEEHMAKKHTEAFWQKFLTDNPFIFRLAFGLPIAIFGEQVAVGGVKFDGTGGKIADYLLRAGAFGNMAIIEIKRPDSKLMHAKAYRGGVHAPDKGIAGAVNQVLDQRYQLQMEINNKKAASAQYDVFTYAIQGLVIAGGDIDDADQRKSFELFRNGLKDVTVITFSELLMKLKALHAFLTKDSSEAQSSAVLVGASPTDDEQSPSASTESP